MRDGLPDGWVRATLEEVADVRDFEREPINSSERESRVIGKDERELYPYYGATGQVGFIDAYRSEGQRVLLGEDAAPFLDPIKDKAYLANGRFWVNNHAHVLAGAAGLVDNKFLCHQLNTVDYHPFVTGSTRLKLTSSAMKQIPLVVAPAAEQTRIVEKLEELLSDLDAGVAELKAAQKKLAQYRQSLLKAAVEGALTAQWRAARAPLSPRGRGAGGEGAYLDTAAPDEAWLKQRAKELRREQTPFEHALWQQLRAKRFSGFEFRRQQLLGRYIVDFVCMEKRLIVEADGGQHNADSDGERDAWLQQQGFRVLRIWNNDIAHQLEAVLESIWQVLQQKPPLPNPSPARGEGLEPETGAQLLQRILRERRARWEARQLARFAGQGKTPPRDWQKKYPEPVPPDTRDFPELPQGWVWASVEQLAELVSGHTPKEAAEKSTTEGETPWFKVSDMNHIGNEDWMVSAVTRFSLSDAISLGMKIAPRGTIIFPKRGGAIATNKKRRLATTGCYDLNTMGLVPVCPIEDWLWHWFLGVDLGKLSDGSNVPQINNPDIAPLCIPIPPMPEQCQIISLLRNGLDSVTQQLSAIEISLKQSAAQRKNILKAAFSGQLVSQDPNDEPASVLLARIRADRDNAAQSPRKLRAATRTSGTPPC